MATLVKFTALPSATFLFAKAADALTVSTSPATRSSPVLNVALVVPSYTRFTPVKLAVKVRVLIVPSVPV